MRLLISLSLLFFALSYGYVERMPDFQDPRDGRIYKTVQIGEQRWMAENLRYKVKGSFCYENKDYNCEKYGRMYNWSMVMMLVDYYNTHSVSKLAERYRLGLIHDVCPMGWHVPANKEWKKMKFFVSKKGISDGVGLSLRATENWEKEMRIPAASDEFGFSALPGGERDFEGRYMDLGRSAVFWTSSEYDEGGARMWWFYYDSRTIDNNYDTKETAASVRCVEDKLYEVKEPPAPAPKVVPKVVVVQGRKMQTVHIGDQVWMADNVDTKVPGSFCYEDKEENCTKYGRLYNWPAVVKLSEKFLSVSAKDSISRRKPKGICPNGWHVPTNLDYIRLNSYLKEIDDGVGVGVNLRSRTGWQESENALLGENGFGFNGEPFGAKKYGEPPKTCVSFIKEIVPGVQDSKTKTPPDTLYVDSCVVDSSWRAVLAYEGLGRMTGFWTGSEVGESTAEAWKLSYDDDDFVADTVRKEEAYYLRCMMDPPDEDELFDSTAIWDKRDDNKYRTVVVGKDVWMAENLRYAVKGSFCYEDKDSRCRSYGRLYPWHVAMGLPADYIENSMSGGITEEHQGICPDGWHVPTNEEWISLGQVALNKRRGGIGSSLKNKEFWARGGAPISAATGFNALPAGSRFIDGEYMELGSSAYFWTAAGGDGLGGVYWYLVNNKDDFTSAEDFDGVAFSLRCVKNKKIKFSPTPAASAP